MFGANWFGAPYFGQAQTGTIPPTVVVTAIHVEAFAKRGPEAMAFATTGPRARAFSTAGPRATNLESV